MNSQRRKSSSIRTSDVRARPLLHAPLMTLDRQAGNRDYRPVPQPKAYRERLPSRHPRTVRRPGELRPEVKDAMLKGDGKRPLRLSHRLHHPPPERKAEGQRRLVAMTLVDVLCEPCNDPPDHPGHGQETPQLAVPAEGKVGALQWLLAVSRVASRRGT